MFSFLSSAPQVSRVLWSAARRPSMSSSGSPQHVLLSLRLWAWKGSQFPIFISPTKKEDLVTGWAAVTAGHCKLNLIKRNFCDCSWCPKAESPIRVSTRRTVSQQWPLVYNRDRSGSESCQSNSITALMAVWWLWPQIWGDLAWYLSFR